MSLLEKWKVIWKMKSFPIAQTKKKKLKMHWHPSVTRPKGRAAKVTLVDSRGASGSPPEPPSDIPVYLFTIIHLENPMEKEEQVRSPSSTADPSFYVGTFGTIRVVRRWLTYGRKDALRSVSVRRLPRYRLLQLKDALQWGSRRYRD